MARGNRALSGPHKEKPQRWPGRVRRLLPDALPGADRPGARTALRVLRGPLRIDNTRRLIADALEGNSSPLDRFASRGHPFGRRRRCRARRVGARSARKGRGWRGQNQFGRPGLPLVGAHPAGPRAGFRDRSGRLHRRPADPLCRQHGSPRGIPLSHLLSRRAADRILLRQPAPASWSPAFRALGLVLVHRALQQLRARPAERRGRAVLRGHSRRRPPDDPHYALGGGASGECAFAHCRAAGTSAHPVSKNSSIGPPTTWPLSARCWPCTSAVRAGTRSGGCPRRCRLPPRLHGPDPSPAL